MSNELNGPKFIDSFRRRRLQFGLRALLAAVFMCGVVFFVLSRVLVPAVKAAREGGRRSACTSHLKIIGMAMQNYHDRFGCFPPAYVAGPDGKPMHSWRALLLPYLVGNGVEKLYNFNERWDGPNNSRLATTLPGVLGSSPIYGCPSNPTCWRNGETNYVMITGVGSIFENGKAPKRSDAVDATQYRIMVVEVADSGIQWLEPRDLELNKMSFRVNDRRRPSISSRHPGGALVLCADASVYFLTNDTDPAIVRGNSPSSGN